MALTATLLRGDLKRATACRWRRVLSQMMALTWAGTVENWANARR